MTDATTPSEGLIKRAGNRTYNNTLDTMNMSLTFVSMAAAASIEMSRVLIMFDVVDVNIMPEIVRFSGKNLFQASAYLGIINMAYLSFREDTKWNKLSKELKARGETAAEHPGFRRDNGRPIALGMTFGMLTGAAFEVMQAMEPGRSFDTTDMVCYGIGFAAAGAFYHISKPFAAMAARRREARAARQTRDELKYA